MKSQILIIPFAAEMKRRRLYGDCCKVYGKIMTQITFYEAHFQEVIFKTSHLYHFVL